jgi:hypothetical protein
MGDPPVWRFGEVLTIHIRKYVYCYETFVKTTGSGRSFGASRTVGDPYRVLVRILEGKGPI